MFIFDSCYKRLNMKKKILLIASIFCALCVNAQLKKKVMFIGNSYTAGLPFMIEDLAISAGDTLESFESTTGGQRLSGHSQDQQTLQEISNQDWDYVVLQEQSQLPSFPESQVQADCYPYAEGLCNYIRKNKSCKMPMFYMTWGRKNGDASNCAFFPPLCTYRGMDSMLRMRYEYMATVNEAELSPVGAVWREIRASYPTIELYSPDESHPSQVGMYASACCFYAAIFRKDPMNITETLGVDSVTALNIRKSAKKIVFDSLSRWKIGEYDLTADFEFTTNSKFEYAFKNLSKNSTSQLWNFEFTTDTSSNPIFGFTKEGKQMVKLTTYNGCDSVTIEKEIDIWFSGIEENNTLELILFPNPSKEYVTFSHSTIKGAKTLKVIDLKGRTILQKEISSLDKNEYLSTSVLKRGVYLVELNTVEGVYRGKFVKE